MAEIEIANETEGRNHWSYAVVVYDQGRRHEFQVKLGWPDYDLWSGGRVAPASVIDAVFRFLLDREPAGQIQRRFDCALVRRLYPDLDDRLPEMISAG